MKRQYSTKLLRYIRKNFDILDYINGNCDYKTTNNPSEVRVCCPNCGEDDYKLYVNIDENLFNCFKCEFSNRNADIFKLIAKLENTHVYNIIDRLTSEFKSITPEELAFYEDEAILESEASFLSVKTIEGLPKDAILLSEQNEETNPFIDYLFNRGFTFQDILDCRIHYVPNNTSLIYKEGKIKGNIGRRVIWPIYGGNNDLVSWVARTIYPTILPKYLNAPGAEQSKTFWPFVLPKNNELVLVEGIIDALAVRKAGFSAYATFGKHLSDEQISILKYWNVSSITVFLDNNAKKEMVSLVSKLRIMFANIYVVDVSHWPKNDDKSDKDSGSMLAYSNGIDILSESLNNKINVTNEMEYLKWQLT